MIRLPRATGDQVILSAEVWNELADEVERQGNLTVAPPLRLEDVSSGRRISIVSAPAASTIIGFRIDAPNPSKGGEYLGTQLGGKTTATAGTGGSTLAMPEGLSDV